MKSSAKRLTPIWVLVLIDILLLAVFLSAFCYFHHIRDIWGVDILPEETQAPVTRITKPDFLNNMNPPNGDSTETVTGTGIPPVSGDDPITGPTYDTSGQFGRSFPQVFAQGENEVNRGDDYYQSHDVYIKVTEVDEMIEQYYSKSSTKPTETHVRYYLADIYVRNIENLFTSYSAGKNKPFETLLNEPNEETNALSSIFAINGDVFNTGKESKEIIVRNGNVIRSQSYISADICVLYWDGTMETIEPSEFDWEEVKSKYPYQAWSFGPELLNDDGSAKTDIESVVWRLNPRAAIGYVEPGHYVLLAVHGSRDDDTSGGDGLNMDTMAKILSDAGCKQAYNLDGGSSVYGYFDGEMLVSFDGKRSISDIICVGEVKRED